MIVDNSSTGIILGAVSLGLVGLMGIVMGTNCMRRSGALNFLSAVGVKTPKATGPLTAEQKAADAAGKKTFLGRIGMMFTSLKGHRAKIVKFVDTMPVPDSVKSFVHDPKSALPKSTRDMLESAENAFEQLDEPADLERATAPVLPVATKTIGTSVSKAPTPLSLIHI